MTHPTEPTYATAPAPAPQPQQMPVVVQILSTILFAGFAIPVTIIAMDSFMPAGIALALFLGWRGGFAPQMNGGFAVSPQLRDLVPTSAGEAPTNSHFAAYKADTLARLEAEQEKFDRFLVRLRDARDKTEFDQFMDDRANRDTAAIPA